MKLGILSDSHGRIPALRQALHVLTETGAEAFIHCGDVGGVDALEELAGRTCWFVWGNTDVPHPAWRAHVEELGLSWPSGPVRLELEGKHIGVFHGHEREFVKAIDEAKLDYLLHGHTHERDDYYVGSMRVINPGALHRVSTRTVATLDLATGTLEYYEVA